jgi:hypothetical protein
VRIRILTDTTSSVLTNTISPFYLDGKMDIGIVSTFLLSFMILESSVRNLLGGELRLTAIY